MAFVMTQPRLSNRRLAKPQGVSLGCGKCMGCPYHDSEMAALGYVNLGLSGLSGLGKDEYELVWVSGSNGLGELGGWFKRVKKAIKKGISQPLKALAVMSVVGAPLMMMKKETRGRIMRRAGGVITGCATGFAGGVVGCVVGGVTGGLMAKKGVKGIKGYGKIGLISAATGFVAGGVVGAAGYGAYGGFGAKAYAFGASKIGALTAGKIGSATSLIPTAMGVMKRSSAPVDETASGGVPTGEGLYSDNWQTPSTPSEAGQSYMDMIKQAVSAVPGNISEPISQYSGDSGGTWGGGEGQLMPDPTGANIPGQEPIEEAPVFAGLTGKHLMMLGGVGLVLMMMYKK